MTLIKNIGEVTALVAEASTANEPSELLDGKSGDTAFPYAKFKALATVGEVDPVTKMALTGYPDGNAAWLKDNDTVRVAYQSESYATMSNETYGWLMESGVKFTGSHIHTIDYDRAKFAKVDFRFASVNEFVNKFRSLKSDPAKVIFAAVTGFSLAKDADKSYSDGVAFYKSQLKNIAPGSTPYVCAGAKGDAGFGTRYVQTANAFKDNGVVLNICEGDNFGAQLSKIANKILLRVVKQCLPAPPDTDKDGKPIMQVLLKRPDATGKVKSIPLHYVEDCSKGKDLDYCVQETTGCSQTAGTASGQDKCNGASDCSGGLQCIEGLCRVYSRAIFFPWVLQPKDEVEVNYGADLGIL